DSGSIAIGQTVKIGYYCQEITDMNPNERVIDYIKDTAEYVRTEEGLVSASAMLERFLFPAEQQYSPIGKLSGGERRRLNLLRVLMEAPNVMILDEPTNDLDTETLAILEDYLDNYDGIVVTVSHDRYFLDRITKRIFAFEGNGKVTQYEGGYTDYMQKRPQEINETSSLGVKSGNSNSDTGTAETKQDSRETWGHQKKLKFTYKEQKEYETIEADIEKLETEIAQLDAEMTKNASNYGKLNALSQEKEAKEELLMEKIERWEYLEELAAKIEAGA
ncbi:MAG: ABC-F family ATP-binding cassette domain-containing protein, partial [Agathobacter sp.]|nr:ABC-F family ATP-binding cassette domain-containing protein [Agathobacter sp.]